MQLTQLCELVSAEMQQVNLQIRTDLQSDIPLIQTISDHIINSGGKRLRPLTVLLIAKAMGYGDGKGHIKLATIIEFIHTATLLHDDVIDESERRRGKKTANTIWGDKASLLVGDFLFSRAFDLAVSLNDLRIIDIFAKTTNLISQGEVKQLSQRYNPDTTEAQYMDIITAKTALLFSAGARLSSMIANASEPLCQAVADFGWHLGRAFQLVDDIFDYDANAQTMGKNNGDDLADGCPTLPLIQALKTANPEQQNLIRNAIINGDTRCYNDIKIIVNQTGALDYTREKAIAETQAAIQALEKIPPSDYRDALLATAELGLHRVS